MLLSGIMYGRQQSNIIDTGIFLNIKCKENRRWSGLMMDFKRYRESLKNTPEPKAIILEEKWRIRMFRF